MKWRKDTGSTDNELGRAGASDQEVPDHSFLLTLLFPSHPVLSSQESLGPFPSHPGSWPSDPPTQEEPLPSRTSAYRLTALIPWTRVCNQLIICRQTDLRAGL